MKFLAATLAESEDFNQRLRQIKAARELPGQPLEINKIAFDILDQLAASADQVVMGFEVAVNSQHGSVRGNLSKQSVFDKETDVFVDRRERNRRNAAADAVVDLLGRVVPRRRHDGLIDDLALMGCSKAIFPRQVAELHMGKTHEN